LQPLPPPAAAPPGDFYRHSPSCWLSETGHVKGLRSYRDTLEEDKNRVLFESYDVGGPSVCGVEESFPGGRSI